MLGRIIGAAAVFAAIVYVMNASWLAPKPEGGPMLIAHRGVHQTYSREGLEIDTCTAERIFEPTHSFIENTLPSMRRAFELGADVVEIDIHPTTDGEFAVFHDWTLDCRTEGRGRTRDHAMAELRALDLGYGYTADGGRTYPLRGQGVGMMPTLAEVLRAFPEERFLINDKANRATDAALLDAYLKALPEARPERLALVSGLRFAGAWRELRPGVPVGTKAEAKACIKSYMAFGWSGYVPEACAYGIGVPLDLRRAHWGWPGRLHERFAKTPGGVIVTGDIRQIGKGTGGVDTLEDLDRLPDDFGGWIITNRIEVIGPAVKDRE